MKKYEYKKVVKYWRPHCDTMMEFLDEQGDEGWKAIFVSYIEDTGQCQIIFVREKITSHLN